MQVLAVVKRQGRRVSEVCHRFEPLPQVLRNVRGAADAARKGGGASAPSTIGAPQLGEPPAGW